MPTASIAYKLIYLYMEAVINYLHYGKIVDLNSDLQMIVFYVIILNYLIYTIYFFDFT